MIILGPSFGPRVVIGGFFPSDFKDMGEVSVKQNQVCRSLKKKSILKITLPYVKKQTVFADI